MNKTLKDFTCKIRSLKRIIENGERIANDLAEKRAVLDKDTDHTDSWKQPRYDEITRNENKEFRAMGENARVLCDSITEGLERIRTDFDFTDPVLQTALSTINALGNKMPYPVREQIVERFRGNPTALDMLLPLYEKNGYNTDAIKAMKEPFQTLGYRDSETFGEFVGRATSTMVNHNTWETGSVKRLLSSYEKAFGLDTSVNPYIAEIDSLYNSSKDARQRANINVYRRRYGEQLAVDDPEAVEEAERCLARDFLCDVV